MPVFRVEKSKDYTTVSNYHLRDKNLSLKSIGLLTIMLSLPEDWDYSLEGLTRITKDGLASVRTAVKELEDNKYLVRNQGRNKNGKFGDIEYLVYETPICEKPISVKPKTEKPISENRTQINTNITKELNNKILNNKYNYYSHKEKSLFEEIESNFGRTLSPYEVEEIGKWEDTDLTRYAIKKAVLNNKFSIQYISRILYQWKMQNIRTVQEAQLQDEDFQKRKDKRKSTYKHEEIVPQWLNEEQTTEPVSESEQKEIEEVFKSLEREINED